MPHSNGVYRWSRSHQYHYMFGNLVAYVPLNSWMLYTSGVLEHSNVANYRYKLDNSIDATSTFVAYKHYGNSVPGEDVIVRWAYRPDLEPGSDRRTENYGNAVGLTDTANIDFAHTQADVAKAVSKLYQEIKGLRTSFSGGTFVGELGDAIKMLRSPLKGLRDGLFSYRENVRLRAMGFRKPKGRLAALNRMISDTWLEFSFGAKPLFNDVDDICDTISDVLDKSERPETTSLEGKSKRQFQRFNTVSSVDLYFPLVGRQYDVDIGTVLVIYRCGFKWESDALKMRHTLGGVRERFGFTLEEFVPTVWNLIPFSFLVDYFANVGDILEASFTNTCGVTWCNRTIYLESVRTTWMHVDQQATVDKLGSNGTIKSISGRALGTSVAKKSSVDRRSTELSVPPLVFITPPVGSLKSLNIAALLGSFQPLSNTLRKG